MASQTMLKSGGKAQQTRCRKVLTWNINFGMLTTTGATVPVIQNPAIMWLTHLRQTVNTAAAGA